jgi:tetratricopeptide (TPR) repeat protein
MLMSIFVIDRLLPMRLAPGLLLLAGLIVGCTSMAQHGKKPVAADSAAIRAADAAAVDSADDRDALPDVDLTAGMLYQIMAAEVAQQRGDTSAALATYLLLARQSRDPRFARRATEIALAGRMTAQAMDSARLWLELAPKSSEAALALATLQIATGRYEEARVFWQAQLKSAAEPVDELAGLQRLLARGPGKSEGFALLDTLAEPFLKDPGRSANVHLILAAGAASAGLTERAANEAKAAIRLDPDSERTTLIAVQTIARLEGNDKSDAAAGRTEALKIVKDFVRRHPDSLEARLVMARLLIAMNQLPEAREQFDEVLKRDAGNADALYARGVLALDGKPPRDEARRYFERYLDALKSSPGSQSPDAAYLNLARIAEDERRYDEALSWLKQVEDGEQYLAARMREANILAKQNQLDAAMKLLQDEAGQPQRSDEERSQLISAQAQLMRDAKRYSESYELLNAALVKSPSDTILLYDTAMAAERLDRMDVMERHLRRVMELQPQDAHSYNALGYSLADRNLRLDEAQQLITQALKLAPNDGYILDSMGWVLFRRGDLAGAQSYLDRAWKSRPESEVGAHLGEVLWQMGDHDGARRIWREAIAADPASELVQSTLARLKVQL